MVMFSTITSAMISGVEPVFIHVEVDIAHGLPGFMLVGYLSGEVKGCAEKYGDCLATYAHYGQFISGGHAERRDGF